MVRYEVSNVLGLNFMLYDVLAGGASRSLRTDSQGKTLEELNRNLAEVIAMLLEDGEPELEAEFVGTQAVQVP